MKTDLIEKIEAESYNLTDQAGNKLIVVELDDIKKILSALPSPIRAKCEWNELSTVEQFTSCGKTKNALYEFRSRRDFKYCPYCGKEIERIVEPKT